jgi:hypothetical protein
MITTIKTDLTLMLKAKRQQLSVLEDHFDLSYDNYLDNDDDSAEQFAHSFHISKYNLIEEIEELERRILEHELNNI